MKNKYIIFVSVFAVLFLGMVLGQQISLINQSHSPVEKPRFESSNEVDSTPLPLEKRTDHRVIQSTSVPSPTSNIVNCWRSNDDGSLLYNFGSISREECEVRVNDFYAKKLQEAEEFNRDFNEYVEESNEYWEDWNSPGESTNTDN